ncbi:hypothetical protein H6G33_13270 [Calothrix sp. FACHB-1219]|uniref:phycobilisome linker polypeptide n=1 Tax=unclassified Calothrix TaxID=2619626 RepID=UPI001689A40B|nr:MULTISPECIES: phycobilisome linker polypeptide [unclassified Calothrix]MBD2204847.1 hypothetical protein [Calothrix sp. FACHB-168]MBD2218005.1 hypothetical protein [Calothrix sp. FACHB-1219]
MASTIIDPGDFSDYSSRQVTIEVTGGCHRELMRKAHYTKTIPYNCLSQTIKSINRQGGKITRVTLSPSHHSDATIDSPESLVKIADSDLLSSAHEEIPTLAQVQLEEPAIPAGNAVSHAEEYSFKEEW